MTCIHAATTAEPATTRSPVPAAGSITGRIQNAVIGRYLTNARISIKGTDIVGFTDEFGVYRLPAVPAGPVVVEVFYTGMDPRQTALDVAPGQTLVHDVNLTNVALYGPASDTVKLGAFVVSTSKETEGEALATNEQRFAANIKNVVATDTFGDVQEGNLGEFIKFLPGVAVNYGDAEALSISLRGFSPNLTGITTDGAQISNANYGGSSRAPFLSQTSINNISRVEVSKVPTPSSAADSLGGSINMVSKSAFERSRAELRYRFYLTGNSHRLKIKDPYTFDNETYKILPSFDFDYTLPVNKDFGVVITGLTTNFYNEQRIHPTAWTETGTGTGASISQSFRSTDVIVDAPRYTWRKAAGLNADWRVAANSVLSVGFDLSYFHSQVANVQRNAQTGTNGTPTIAVASGGVPFNHSPTHTTGATGRGAVNLSGNSTNRYEQTRAGKVRYRFDNGDWRINAGLSRSASSTKFRGGSDGWVFSSIAGSLDVPARVSFSNISPVGKGDSTTVVEAFDNSGRPLELNDMANYRVTTATIATRDITDNMAFGDLNVRRRLGFLSFPAAVQLGGLHRIQKRDSRIPSVAYTYNGSNGSRSAKPYQYQTYVNQDSGFGARNIPFLNVGRASRAFKADSSLFAQTPAQVVSGRTSGITTSEYIREAVTAGYAQAEMQLFSNRLRLLTGVRYETTTGEGEGPLNDPGAAFVRNANGTFTRNAAGQRIRKPEAGAVNSIEELLLTRTQRGNRAKGTYDGYFPSLHVTYHVTDNFQARAAYAKTYGRPNFNEIIPNVVINERDLDESQLADPSVIPGFITLRNPRLKPWTADNFDVSLEYYTAQGGVFTAGVFVKDIKDFFGNDVRRITPAEAEEYGLDPRYAGFQVTTKMNAGDARVSGVEVSLRHSLARLGSWGRPFSVFFNATKLRLEGERQADFSGFIDDTRSWGVTFARHPLTLMAKWNWRGEQKNAAYPNAGPDGYNYTGARTHLDLNADYQFGKRMSFFVNARNIFDVRNESLRYGSQTPGYAKVISSAEYGVQLGAGVKGSF
ncbi:MAG: TonB-dependent receptor [Opitutaceae bacterium]|nr:TonB-dependent receptor [Opitutaceae bacterium]